MWEDPIVAEVHRTRMELAAKFNFDLKAIFADIRKRQAEAGVPVVSPPPKPTPSSQSAKIVAPVPAEATSFGCDSDG